MAGEVLCPMCGLVQPVSLDGTLVTHEVRGMGVRCGGSGMPAADAARVVSEGFPVGKLYNDPRLRDSSADRWFPSREHDEQDEENGENQPDDSYEGWSVTGRSRPPVIPPEQEGDFKDYQPADKPTAFIVIGRNGKELLRVERSGKMSKMDELREAAHAAVEKLNWVVTRSSAAIDRADEFRESLRAVRDDVDGAIDLIALTGTEGVPGEALARTSAHQDHIDEMLQHIAAVEANIREHMAEATQSAEELDAWAASLPRG